MAVSLIEVVVSFSRAPTQPDKALSRNVRSEHSGMPLQIHFSNLFFLLARLSRSVEKFFDGKTDNVTWSEDDLRRTK